MWASLDEAFEDGKIDQKTLDLEKTAATAHRDLNDVLEAEQEAADTEPGASGSEGEKQKAEEEKAKQSLADPQEALDEVDSEGLTPYRVQAKTPGARPKVHLPSVAQPGGEAHHESHPSLWCVRQLWTDEGGGTRWIQSPSCADDAVQVLRGDVARFVVICT